MLHLKRVLRAFLCVLLPLVYTVDINAQCLNGTAFGTSTMPTVGNSMSFAGIYAGEYRTCNSAVSGNTYTVSSTTTSDYLTVRRQTYNGLVVASGPSPLTFVNNFTGTVYIHINTNSGCGTQSLSRTITVVNGAPFNPCASIPTVTCGTAINTVVSGAGAWNVTSCGYSTPGREQLYSFTPTVTGAYSINVNSVVGGYVDYYWKAASGGCNATGWNCIDDIAFTGTFPVATLTAGVQYYFLLDPEGTGSYTHNWTINCLAGFDPCASIPTVTCGNAINTVITSGSGAWSPGTCGYSTPGREQLYSFTPTVTGAYTINVNSVAGGYVDYFWKAASGGCNATGWNCIDDINFTGTFPVATLTAGVQYYFLLDPEGTGAYTHNWTINCVTPPFDPCASIATVNCGTLNSTVLSGSSTWATAACGFTMAGREAVFSFTPTVTGPYSINASSITGGYIDFLYKAASGGCNSGGWTCLADISGPATFPVATLTAGVQYYFLLDKETTASGTANWTITGTSATTPTVNASVNPLCSGSSTTLSIASGTLNNNTQWSWYAGSCGGTAAGTGTSITVSPTTTTTYFVQGTGGACAPAGACGQVTVTVNNTPVITGQPAGANLCAGSPLNLSVTASNAAGYQWYLNSSPIPGATGATYNVPSATTANAGNYYAVAMGVAPCGNATSNTVTVNVTNPATVTSQPPANVGVCQGGTLTLGVSATGATSYQWYKDNVLMPGEISPTYSFVGATSANAGTYHLVMGSNSPCGNVQTMNYVVSITPNPTITTQPPAFVSACAGSPLNITVVAANTLTYEWYKDNVLIPGATAATYNVPSSSSANQGLYHVIAVGNNGCGTVQSTSTFAAITQPATITVQPAPTTTICAGSTLNLNATVTNAASYQWYRNSVLIPGATSATYNVGSATTADAGTYHLVVTSNSPCGNATSSNAVVNVTTPASITTPPPAAISVCNGSALTITAAGANTTGYQWYRNNVLIAGATSATYSVPAVTSANAGTYHVVLGSNSPCAAATSSNCIVTVTPRPTAVITTSPTPICNGQFASMSVAFTGTGPWTFTRFDGTTSVTETVSSNPYVFYFTPTVTTTYSITALNDVNCTAIPADYAGTATKTVNPRPTALISTVGPTTICNGSPANMSIALTGTGPWTFNYSNGVTSTQVTTFANPYTFTVSPSTTSTYTINVLLDANCIATPADYAGSATITVNQRPTASLGILGAATLCNGGSTTMQVALTGTAPWTFNYNDGTTNTSVTTSTNPYTFTVTPSVTTTYTITSLLDANCTALPVDYAGPATVNVNPRPTAAISVNGASTVCNGTPTNINVALTGTGPWTFGYSDGTTTNIVTANTSPYILSVTPSTTSAYSITSLLDANCTAIPADYAGSAMVIVNQRPTAAVVVTGATTVCDGTGTNIDINLTGTGPWLFQYFDGSTTTTVGTATSPYSFTVAPSATTTYSVTMLSDANCSAISADMATTGTVTVNPRPTATIAANSAATICEGSSVNMDVTFTGTAPWTFDYFDGTTTTNVTSVTNIYSFTVAPNVSTTYSITSLVDANCTAQAGDYATTVPVTVNHAPAITAQPQSVTECSGIGTSLSVTATGTALTYQWTKDGVNISDGATYNGTNTSVLMINSITGTSGSYEVIIGGTCPPVVTSNAVTVTEDVNNIWNGAIDESWSVAGNWSCGTVPIVTTNVLIPGNALLEPLVNIPTAICNTLTIEPLATVAFTGVNNALEIKSTITNGGTFDAVLGKVILSGTGAQNIPGVTYKDLEIEGGSTKSLDGNATITGILSLMDGYVALGDYDLTLNVPAQTMGGSASSFIVTNDTGVVVGKNMGAVGGNPDAVMFHVGTDASAYTPIMLENLGDADDYSVRVMQHVYVDGHGVNPLMVTNPVTDRTWMVTEGVVGGSIVNMNPYWNIAQEINGFDQSHVYVAHYTGGEWTAHIDSAINAPAAGTFGTMFFADADSIDTFSPFTVASLHQFPLSIKLRDIAAANVGTSNRVDWSSASEDAGDVYHLERSADGKTFAHIADIDAKGVASTYTYWDETPVTGRNYYRLRMAGTDGKFYYSKVVSALVKASDAAFSISVYPNPVKHSVSVSVNGDVSGKATVVVTDATGKMVKAVRQITGRTVYINMEDMAQGMYFIKYSDDLHNETIKVNKQ